MPIASFHAVAKCRLVTLASGCGVDTGKYSSGMRLSGGMRTAIAVTRKVTPKARKKYGSHRCMMSRVLATITMNVTETVEKPVAMMAASRPVYRPAWYMRSVIKRPSE